jgi:hypothetical protein
MFDPSKMDPKVLMEMSQLVQQLPPNQIQRMQTLMHNMMAGFDVRRDMEEFEKSLPPGFREKLTNLMLRSGVNPPAAEAAPKEMPQEIPQEIPKEINVREARLTILKAVAEGSMTPEEAEKLL